MSARSTSWVRERDVDLLLAESLSTLPGFVQWFVARVPVMAGQAQSVERCNAVVNFKRPDARGDATGETDVLAQVDFTNGERCLISIEDKVLASPRLNQGRRHRAYLESQPHEYTAAVLVAPSKWVEGHRVEAETYDCVIPIEAIAAWHNEQYEPAVQWRGRVLAQAAEQRSAMAPAPDLDAWCDDLDEAIKSQGLRLAPQARQKSDAPGQAVSGRFIWCAEDTLGDVEDLWAALFFKHASANYPGRVSIDIALPKDDPRGIPLALSAEDAGFRCRRTKAYLIVESCPPEAAGFNMVDSVADQLPAVTALAHAAKELQLWWNALPEAGPLQ